MTIFKEALTFIVGWWTSGLELEPWNGQTIGIVVWAGDFSTSLPTVEMTMRQVSLGKH